MASIGFTYAKIHGYKRQRGGAGMRQMQSSRQMQAHLVGVAESIASILNNYGEGHYEVGPYGEPVYAVRHPYPIGAHAFIRTADWDAKQVQAAADLLSMVLGGG